MDDHIDVLCEIIKRTDDAEISRNDDLQQTLEPRPPLNELPGFRLGSGGHHDGDPAFEQEIDDVGTEEPRPSRDENAAASFD